MTPSTAPPKAGPRRPVYPRRLSSQLISCMKLIALPDILFVAGREDRKRYENGSLGGSQGFVCCDQRHAIQPLLESIRGSACSPGALWTEPSGDNLSLGR